MKLELLRYASGPNDTLGLLFDASDHGRHFLCYTLEDEYRAVKVAHETRIPAGLYSLALRREGGLHEKYLERFPSMHRGMLWIQNIPGFEWVYLHVGNIESDTDGCPLLGDEVVQNITGRGKLVNSEAAYRRVYPQIASAIDHGAVQIQVTDFDSMVMP